MTISHFLSKRFFLISTYCALILLCDTQLFPLVAQEHRIKNYYSLYTSRQVPTKDYAIQIARILPQRQGWIQKVSIYTDGGVGGCKVHFYGHEGGTNFPWFGEDLLPPYRLRKSQQGKQTIDVVIKDSLFIENDQFYIVFTDFEGDFSLLGDSTFLQPFCHSKDGGNFYPTLLLEKDSSAWLKDSFHLAMDIYIDYVMDTEPIFRDVTNAVGLPLNASNHSIAWGDINHDHWQDLLLGDRLFLNKGGIFEEVSDKWLPPKKGFISRSCFFDMNNDGLLDILLLGNRQSHVLINNGNEVFIPHLLNIPPLQSLHGYGIADVNQDKFPDLVLAQLWGEYPIPMTNYLFLNDGNLNFLDITEHLYPQHESDYNFSQNQPCRSEADCFPNQNRNRRSRGAQFTDIDGDGDVDLYIANYFLEMDELYVNDGSGFFKSVAAPKPLNQNKAVNNHGTGVDWYDYDNDGDFDLLLPQLAHPNFMLAYDHRGTTIFNNQNGAFIDQKETHGIHYEETHAGACFGDVNNDGLADIVTTVYYGCRYIDLYLQQPNHTFQLSTYQGGLSKINTGNDACFVDFNNDGKLDLALGEKGKFRLYKNDNQLNHNWLQLNLISTSNNHFSIGTKVKVYTDQAIYTQEVNVGRGQGVQKPSILHFGLGEASKVLKVEVYWREDKMNKYLISATNYAYTITEK